MGSRQILAVVKANAYGHGTVPVARALAEAGADVLGVSHIEEALELREAGLSLPLVLLFGFAPPDAVRVIEHEVVPVIWRIDQAQALSDAAVRLNRPASYHVKIDTGMGRVGVRQDQAMAVIKEMVRLPAIRLDGLSSHCSDADSEDASMTEEQIRMVRACRAAGLQAGDGRELLLAQGAHAFERFFPGQRAPRELMRAAVNRALSG